MLPDVQSANIPQPASLPTFTIFIKIIHQKNMSTKMAVVCANCKKEGLNRPGIDPTNIEYGHDVMVSLEIAAADGHPECFRAIIDAGADVNKTECRRTPL